MKKSVSKVCAVIPAHNEAARIGKVLSIVTASTGIDEVIVIDDGSTDETQAVAAKFNKVKVKRLDINQGKTGAVMHALSETSADFIFLFDADLLGLTVKTIDIAIDQISNDYDMLILNYCSQEFVLHSVIKSFPALSGVRLLARSKLLEVPLQKNDGFALETRINDWAIAHRWHMGILGDNQIRTPHKYEKYPLVLGIFLEIKGIVSIMVSDGIWGIPRMFRSWHYIAGLKVETRSIKI